jgi:hypothetical protein
MVSSCIDGASTLTSAFKNKAASFCLVNGTIT